MVKTRTLRPEAPADGVVLRAENISAGYGAAPAISDVSLEVRAGEILCLLGANGAGKTTTLLALCGELPLKSGEVVLSGRVAKSRLHQLARQGLAFVPDERAVFRRMTCRENLGLGPADIDVALDLFPALRPRLDVAAGLLSGGEQQMVALGRALSMRPSLLVVDELSLGLAPKIVTMLFETIRSAADDGLAVLIVEQHVRQVLKYADSAHVMQRGRITLSGTAADLLGRIDEVEASYLSASVA